ncbi:unnamed protein product, partial [Closterium sp. NIES-53]
MCIGVCAQTTPHSEGKVADLVQQLLGGLAQVMLLSRPPSCTFLSPSLIASSRLRSHLVPPSRIVPSRVMPSRIMPSRVMPSRIMPSRIMPSRVMPSRIMPSRVMPSRIMPISHPTFQLVSSSPLPISLPRPLPALPVRWQAEMGLVDGDAWAMLEVLSSRLSLKRQ